MAFVNHDNIHQLFKYISEGLLLPVTEEQYRSRVFLPAHVSEKVSDIVRHITEAHASIKPQCEAYKDDLHPTIVQLAIEVHEFIQEVTKGLDQTQDAFKVKVEEHVYKISILADAAQKVVHSLEAFRGHILAHCVTLQTRGVDTLEMRDAQVNSLREGEAQLQGSRDDLATNIALHAEYRSKALMAAGMAATIPLAGPLAGGITAAVYLKKASDTADRIADIKQHIERQMAILNATNAVIACLHVIEADLKSVIALSSEATITLSRIIAFWQRLFEDLTQIKETLNRITGESSSATAFAAVLRVELKAVGAVVAEYKEVVHNIDEARHDAVNSVLAQLTSQ
ncbi:hypothetical protein GGG16DRAFT_113050 [Schizophyllum commune]